MLQGSEHLPSAYNTLHLQSINKTDGCCSPLNDSFPSMPTAALYIPMSIHFLSSVLRPLLCAWITQKTLVLAQSSSQSSVIASTISASLPAASVAQDRMTCQAADIYQRPGAWNSYVFPGIEEINGAVVNSSKTWNLTVAVAQVDDMYSSGSQAIERTLFLDTSSTINGSIGGAPFSACSIVLSLPAEYNNKYDPGDCTSIFDDDCVRDLKAAVANQAKLLAGQKTIGSLQACNSFTQQIDKPPPSCSKFTDSKSHSLASGSIQESYLNFGKQINYTNCTNPPPTNPINFFTQVFEPGAGGQNTTVDAQAGIISPVLIALFSNASNYSGPAFGDSQLICAKPENTPHGTVPSTSGAVENIGGFTAGAGIALALNAILFFLL